MKQLKTQQEFEAAGKSVCAFCENRNNSFYTPMCGARPRTEDVNYVTGEIAYIRNPDYEDVYSNREHNKEDYPFPRCKDANTNGNCTLYKGIPQKTKPARKGLRRIFGKPAENNKG